jgi:D-inositol-3-phosphate glycosyltransferase
VVNPELSRLKRLTNELGLRNIVCFEGVKDQASLPYYYAAALAVIMPSDYESFGMVALEAMASGTPVVASGVGGLAYLVRDGETGFLVPVREPGALAQAVTALLTDPGRRGRMGNAAAELARKYTWGIIAAQLIAVFNRVIELMGVSHRKR